MDSRFARWTYLPLAVLWLCIATWQFTAHQHAGETLRGELLLRAQDISQAIAVVIRAEGRFDGVPQHRVEAMLKELTASTDLRSVSLRDLAGTITAQAGPELLRELDDVSQEKAYWMDDSAVLVNLVDFGPPHGRKGPGGPGGRGGRRLGGEPDGGRGFEGRPPRREMGFFSPEAEGKIQRHLGGAPLNDNDVEEIIALFPPHMMTDDTRVVMAEALTGKVLGPELLDDLERVLHNNAPRPPRRGGPGFRWRGRDQGNTLNNRGVHAFVLEVPASEVYTAVRKDFQMRVLLVALVAVVFLAVVLLVRTVQRGSDLQIRLARSEATMNHLAELNTAAAGLVHETKNPLNLIRGQAQMLGRDAALASEGRETARRIMEEADRVTGRLNQFLDYSKPLAPALGRVDVEALVNDVFKLLECDREDKEITLEYRAEGTNAIQADGDLFRQVIFNLLINAIEAVDAGGRIEVVLRRDEGKSLRLDVRDDGGGVDESLQGDLFQPYVTGTAQGTGLGLTIVRQIALAHGWAVSCGNNRLGGATFRVTQLEAAE